MIHLSLVNLAADWNIFFLHSADAMTGYTQLSITII